MSFNNLILNSHSENIDVSSTMLPKFLTVGACEGRQTTVWNNDTFFIEKTVLFGDEKHQLDIIARALGFSYEVKFPPDLETCGRYLVNGTYSGAFGMLQRGEVDMIISSVLIEEEMNDEFRFRYPHSMCESTFMTKKPQSVPNAAVFLHPFSVPVWFTITACFCLMSLIFPYLLRRKYSTLSLFTSILGSLVGQGMSLTPRRPREYLVLATWILGSAFLYHFYAAVLLSFVTFPPLQGIRTIEDLANGIKAGNYECAIYEGSDYSDIFIDTESPALKVIGHNLKYCDHDNFIEYLEESGGDENPVFALIREDFLFYKDYYYVSEDNFMFFPLAFATRKDFCCGLELDKTLHRVWASGIFKKFSDDVSYRWFLQESKEFSKNWDTSSSETKLTMMMLKGPFIFLIVSHSGAFLVFLIEVCIGKCKMH